MSVFSTSVSAQCFLGLTLAPACRSDGGSSVPRWPRSLRGDCAPAAGLSPGTGPAERSARPALSDPVLLYRDYGGLSRPGAPRRAQERPPQHRETVSIDRGHRFKSAASLYKTRTAATIPTLKLFFPPGRGRLSEEDYLRSPQRSEQHLFIWLGGSRNTSQPCLLPITEPKLRRCCGSAGGFALLH